jgi:hypothetical protein
VTVTDQIRTLLAAKADAVIRRAPEELEPLIHVDFIYVNASGSRFDKAGYIEAYCVSGKIVFREQKVSELEVKPFDGFAVATMVLNDRFSVGGRDVTATYRSLCVFSRAIDRWQWVAGQTMAAQ